ncbi:MAG: hypothetical protein SOW44_06030 [Porphyromonas sp.]|nr:hypothetical protein [Bacteroidales bacterium]MDD7560113.1 hypothetical protein [Bacteroidales bacterium]MDY3100884.1 hypothetical protein [Porphyromonas sp.]
MQKNSLIPVALIAALSLLSGCMPGKSGDEYQASYDSLMLEKSKTEANLNDMLGLINEVEANLSQLTAAEQMIQVGTANGELSASAKDRIRGQIQALSATLEENKTKLNEQAEKLRKSNINISALDKKIKDLQSRLEEKERVIADLTGQLDGLRGTVAQQDSLIGDLSEAQRSNQTTIELQDQKIARQESELYTGYYCFGTQRELKDQKILSGGGLFSSMKVLPDGFNKDYFLAIDTRNVQTIELFAPKARLRTNHPSNSYRFDTDGDGNKILRITDTKAFWSNGKYLVIEVEPK